MHLHIIAGELHRPPSSAIFYIPQRPYMPIGTLRDQLIYPDSISEFSLKGGRDEHLEELLNAVQMEHLLIRYSRRGFDTWSVLGHLGTFGNVWDIWECLGA